MRKKQKGHSLITSSKRENMAQTQTQFTDDSQKLIQTPQTGFFPAVSAAIKTPSTTKEDIVGANVQIDTLLGQNFGFAAELKKES